MVITQSRNHPDPADQQLLVFFNDTGPNLRIPDAQVGKSRLVTVFLLVQANGHPVDHLVTAPLTHQRFHLLGLVRAHVVLRQHGFDVPQARFDHLRVIRGAIHAQQVLQHVHGHIRALFDLLGQILAHHPARKVLVE